MINVKVSTSCPEWPLLRQTPKSKGRWGDCRFFVNQDIEAYDYWVVCEGLMQAESAVCPRENTIFITWEPPAIKVYNKDFLDQFGAIITCHRDIKHPNVIYSQQGLPWMVGGRYKDGTWDKHFSKDYDELKLIEKYEKKKLISVILSTKSFAKGHIEKNRFVKRLKTHFGDKLDVFGVGINVVPDKWDAISPYKYHIVLENSSLPDYWTEKLSDAYLAGAYPFYYGCKNMSDYFSGDVFTNLDIDDFDRSVAIIEKAIDGNKFENSFEKIMEAKKLILDKYNLFPWIDKYCKNNKSSASMSEILLRPESDFKIKSTFYGRCLSMLRGAVC